MSARDTLRDAAYFDRHLARIEASIERLGARIADPDTTLDHRRRLRHTVYRRELEKLVARYSHGDPPAALRASFSAVLRRLAEYQQDAGSGAHHFRHFDAYVFALWIVSLGVLLEVTDEEFRLAVDLLGNQGGDALFDRLVALRIPARTRATELLYPDVYRPLYEALVAEGARRAVLIQIFLDRWYAGMSDTYWHDSHLAEDTGYFGYWCFELAAFVKALGVDDRTFADFPFYPRDLARATSACRTNNFD